MPNFGLKVSESNIDASKGNKQPVEGCSNGSATAVGFSGVQETNDSSSSDSIDVNFVSQRTPKKPVERDCNCTFRSGVRSS
ncbi:hypothetical protein AC249_AIPGENE19593 [Exaiptasia diaphana]|nr:hypothetical protein AC249_AIPGENE19593 [Exaiptasia diaphana]